MDRKRNQRQDKINNNVKLQFSMGEKRAGKRNFRKLRGNGRGIQRADMLTNKIIGLAKLKD